MIVNTRNGLFSNAGYGGGLFNGNVAFGAVESTATQALEMRQHRYMDVSNLNAPYDNMSLQGLGSLGAEDGGGFNMEQEHNIPWMEASPTTLSVQKSINKQLIADGFNPVLEDGVLGPRTCGALQHYGKTGDVWGACDAHTAEFIAPTKASGGSPVLPKQDPVMMPSSGGSGGGMPSWVWAILVGGGAVGVAIYLKKKKRGR